MAQRPPRSNPPRQFTVAYSRVVIARSNSYFEPPTDVIDVGDALVVRVEIAGLSEQDFDIVLHRNRISISGVRPFPNARAYHQIGVEYGDFRSDVSLPVPVRTDAVEASYDNGLLVVTLPKQEEAPVRVTPKKTTDTDQRNTP